MSGSEIVTQLQMSINEKKKGRRKKDIDAKTRSRSVDSYEEPSLPDFLAKQHNKSQYATNWRLFIPLLIATLVDGVFIRAAIVSNEPLWLTLILIIFCALISIICIVIIVYSYFFDTKRDNYSGVPLVGKILNPLYYDTRKELSIFLCYQESSAPMVAIIALLYGCIGNMIITIALLNVNITLDECDATGKYTNVSANIANACVYDKLTYGPSYSWAAWISTLVFLFKPSKQSQNNILELKSKLDDTKLTNILLTKIDQNINACLKYWIKTKFQRIKSDRNLTIVAFIICVAVHTSFGIIRVGIFDTNLFFISTIIMACAIFIFDSIILTMVMLSIFRMMKHFQFATVIMESLVVDFDELIGIDNNNINNHDDYNSYNNKIINNIIKWNKIRYFYLYVIIDHYGNNFGYFINTFLIGSIILIFATFFQVNESDTATFITNLLFTPLVICPTLILAQHGVTFAKHQLKHLETLNEFKISYIASNNGVSNANNNGNVNNNYMYNEVLQIIDCIGKDIENKMYCFEALSIKIDARFMIGLKTGVSAFIVTAATRLVLLFAS